MSNQSMKRGLLASSIFAGFVGGLWASAAVAQDAPDDTVAVVTDQEDDEDEARQEKVVITGSRIRRNVDATVPITTIGSVEIEDRGFVNAIEGIEQLPLTGGGSNNLGANTQFGSNNAFADLLNLGTNRTLTLVNGRRFVGSNQATVFVPFNEPGAQVDLTIINPAFIERQEVQTVGGSAIYGADAVAGVINVILKDDYEGFEVTAQGGLTQFGDGGQYRVTGAWGTELFGGRGHFSVGAEWLDLDIIRGGGGRDFSADLIGTLENPLSFTGSDGIPDNIFQAGLTNPLIPAGGLLTNGGGAVLGGIADPDLFFFPNDASQTTNPAAFNAFVAEFGSTPFAFVSNNGLQGLDPALFFGTFAAPNSFFTVPNTDPATSGVFPLVAAPLTFNSAGDLVPFDLGTGLPPLVSNQETIVGGDGFAIPEQANLRSGQERFSLNLLWNYDITPNITYKGDFLFSNINNASADGAPAQTLLGSTTAGNFGLPIFIDENPFLSPQALAALNDIEAQNGGNLFQTIGGSRVTFLNRALFDINGGLSATSGNESRTFRTTQELLGEFNFLGRDWFWDVAFIWGRNTSDNNGGTDILDIEFALASDVVQNAAGEIVCRQQTLAAPEAIDVRNPNLTNINIATPGGIVPTQAQIDACVPLNLFGDGAPSAEAIDFVTGPTLSRNFSQQFYASASLSGTIVELPAGPLGFSSQFEWRQEELLFTPGAQFLTGSGRATIGQVGEGQLTFFEGGTEFNAPIFGDGFNFIGFNRLELDGAARVVARSGQGTDPTGAPGDIAQADGTINVTFNAGGRWSPVPDVTIRGNRSRSVRSASIVELFGAPQTAFVGGLSGFNPCGFFFIGGGPEEGTRAANCATFAAQVGLDLTTFQPPFITGPVATGGNPALENEVSNAWTVGVVLEPRFIPNLVITSDYFDILIDGELDLAFPGFDCFDQPDFPASIVGGVPTCENFVLAVGGVIPTINPITGNPTIGSANPGVPSPSAVDFSVGFAQFSQINQGSTRLTALNSTISYNFDLNNVAETVFGSGIGFDLGDVFLNGNVYYLRSLDASSSGTFVGDVNPAAGEPGNPNFETRLDVSHRIGKLTHTLQWFRTGETIGNLLEEDIDDQQADFFLRSFNTFNYNVRYEFTDNVSGRLIVNNLTNAQLEPQLGIPGSLLGRNFIFTVTAKF